MATPELEFVWQDRDIKFDSKHSLLSCRSNEIIIDSINSVEDTKGNNGERGSLIVTNLRLIWVSHVNSKINLSIGFNTVLSMSIKKAKSKLRGHTQALCVMAKQNSRYEFVFTSLVKNSPRLFTTSQAVLRAYQTSKLYRDLKLRGSVVKDNELILLPLEQVYSKVAGVWNLSSDQGNLGTIFLTNVRIVWHANLAANFNVSLPYIQIKGVRLRESKFGVALVVETFPRAGGYVLGFRIDPDERLEQLHKEISSYLRLFSSNPVFGVEHSVESENAAAEANAITAPRIEEDVELIEDQEDVHAVAAYLVEGNEESDVQLGDGASGTSSLPVDANLGLAVEPTQGGITIESLWRVT